MRPVVCLFVFFLRTNIFTRTSRCNTRRRPAVCSVLRTTNARPIDRPKSPRTTRLFPHQPLPGASYSHGLVAGLEVENRPPRSPLRSRSRHAPALNKEDDIAVFLAALARTRRFGFGRGRDDATKWRPSPTHAHAPAQELRFRCAGRPSPPTRPSAATSPAAASGGPHRCAVCRRGVRHGSAGARRPQALPLLAGMACRRPSPSPSPRLSRRPEQGRPASPHRLGSDFDLNLTPLPENDAGMMKRWAEERGEVQSPSPIKNRRVSDY
jgi:hypothetical protein